MLLRNGKIYKYRESLSKKCKLSGQRCCICSIIYKKLDKVSSCCNSNLQLHSFHTSCFFIMEKFNGKATTCPYCCQKLYKPTRVIVI